MNNLISSSGWEISAGRVIIGESIYWRGEVCMS